MLYFFYLLKINVKLIFCHLGKTLPEQKNPTCYKSVFFPFCDVSKMAITHKTISPNMTLKKCKKPLFQESYGRKNQSMSSITYTKMGCKYKDRSQKSF